MTPVTIGLCTGIVGYHEMALEERDGKTAAELLAEATGRDPEEFEVDEDMEFPDPDELEEHDPENVYSES
jgi:hypothetical protein